MGFIGISLLLWDYYLSLWRYYDSLNGKDCHTLYSLVSLLWDINGHWIIYLLVNMIHSRFILHWADGMIYSVRTGKAFFRSLVYAYLIWLMKGYLSIFLVGMDVGSLILPAKPLSLPYIRSSRMSSFISLILCSILSIAAFQLTTLYFGLTVSRRFVTSLMMLLTKANLPYVLWTVAHNTTFLLGYLVIQTVFFSAPNTPYDEAVPWTLEAFNRNGLAMFLLVSSTLIKLI